MKFKFIAGVFTVAALVGCGESKDIDWWYSHDEERAAKLEECFGDKTGKLMAREDCQNADSANTKKVIDGWKK